MRRPVPQGGSAQTKYGYYAIILVLVSAILWVMSSSPEAYMDAAANSKVLDLLLEENARLTVAADACKDRTRVRGSADRKGDSDASCDCGKRVKDLEAEVKDLRARLAQVGAESLCRSAASRFAVIADPAVFTINSKVCVDCAG